ncbi:tyrosine-type recombinase/integrase [Cellulomonas iranensis]|uniref:tyrosine-type recombinase/integrase n=1 Tax=Cellulomonas iranensis TaxID=76862 RepID=UPI003D7CB648
MLGILRGVTKPVAAVQAACLLRVQLSTALRIGEVLALTTADVVLDGPTPTVTVGATVMPASPRGLIRRPMAKSEDGHRVVPLTHDGVDALREAAALGLNRRPDRLWLPSMTGGRLRQPGAIRTELARLVGGTDLAEVISHNFRKTTATRVARAYDNATAAALLGHSGTGTIRHYVQRSHRAPDARDVLDVNDLD